MMEDSDGEWIKVRVGPTKSSTIRNIYSTMDDYYSQRSGSPVQEQSDQIDEDPDVRTDSSIGSSSDASTVDSEPGSETGDTSESDAQTEPVGSETDDGAVGSPDIVEESTGGSDEQPPAAERDYEEGYQRSKEYGSAGFHFAPGQHSRGTSFY